MKGGLALLVMMVALNVPMIGLGLFALVRSPSGATAVSLLLLSVGPTAAIVLAHRWRRHASPTLAQLGRHVIAWTLMWNLAILGGLLLPLALKGATDRLALLAPVGIVAALNAVLGVAAAVAVLRAPTPDAQQDAPPDLAASSNPANRGDSGDDSPGRPA